MELSSENPPHGEDSHRSIDYSDEDAAPLSQVPPPPEDDFLNGHIDPKMAEMWAPTSTQLRTLIFRANLGLTASRKIKDFEARCHNQEEDRKRSEITILGLERANEELRKELQTARSTPIQTRSPSPPPADDSNMESGPNTPVLGDFEDTDADKNQAQEDPNPAVNNSSQQFPPLSAQRSSPAVAKGHKRKQISPLGQPDFDAGSPSPKTASKAQKTASQSDSQNPPPTPSTAAPKPTTRSQASRKSWADIAKQSRPQIPTQIQSRVEETRKALLAAGFKASTPKPKPIAVYFGKVPRGPLGSLRKALLVSLPRWAILGLSFIGNQALEVLCHAPLKDRLIATMKSLRFSHLTTYDPCTPIQGRDAKQSRKSCFRRWSHSAASTPSDAARKWYLESASKLSDAEPILELEFEDVINTHGNPRTELPSGTQE